VLQVSGSIIIPSVELLKVKVSQQFAFFWCCSGPSLSQVQVELLKVKVSQQFTFSGAAGLCGSIIIQVQVELLKVKVSQQFTFSGAGRLCCTIIPSECVESESIPTVHFCWLRLLAHPHQVTGELLKVKVSQQFCFSRLQVVVPSLSQVQVELSKSPNSSLPCAIQFTTQCIQQLFCYRPGGTHYPKRC
jgi:hypothetical protein